MFYLMKTNAIRNWFMVGMSVFTAAALSAGADEMAPTTQTSEIKEKTCTGMVKSVDVENRTVTVSQFLGSKQINLGESCVFTFADADAEDINGVRQGQKVTLAYQDANGVLVASRLTQKPLLHTGTVKAVNSEEGTVKVGSRTFRIADGCEVALRNDQSGTVEDVKPGHLVTVLHEKPGGVPLARRIAQTSETYTGSLTAIDLSERTIKAKATLGSKTFRLADNCSILLSGKPAEMKNLKPGDKLEFSYDEVDGVNVATRIAPANEQVKTTTAQTK